MIVKTPNVLGGRARLDGTRIPVWMLARCWLGGWTNAQIIDGYPHLNNEMLVAAKEYWHANRDEINQDIADQQGEM